MAHNVGFSMPGHSDEYTPRPDFPTDLVMLQQNLDNTVASATNTYENENVRPEDPWRSLIPSLESRDDRSIATTIDDIFYHDTHGQIPAITTTLTRSISGPIVLNSWKTWPSRLSRFLKSGNETKTSKSFETPIRKSRAVMAPKDDLWLNGQKISIVFLDGGKYQKMKFRELLHVCKGYVNLQFVEISPEAGCGDIRITFNGSASSESSIGTRSKEIDADKPTLCLRGIHDHEYAAIGMSWQEKYTIFHEIGHALGLLHEHQSPNRSHGLKLREKETIDYFRKNHSWGTLETKEEVLAQLNPKQVSSFSEFDPTSNMMYRFPEAIVKGRWEHGLTVNHELSPLDKAYLTLHYAPPKPPPSANTAVLQWKQNVGNAMQIAGVSPKDQERILSPPSVTPDDIRNTFIEWNRERHMRKPSWSVRHVRGAFSLSSRHL